MRYQTFSTPDRSVFYTYAPGVGRLHNITLYRESGLDNLLQNTLLIDGVRYCIYGDSAYMLRPWLQISFPRVTTVIADLEYNTAMNGDRTAVEWSYKDLKQLWTSQDFNSPKKKDHFTMELLELSTVRESNDQQFLMVITKFIYATARGIGKY